MVPWIFMGMNLKSGMENDSYAMLAFQSREQCYKFFCVIFKMMRLLKLLLSCN